MSCARGFICLIRARADSITANRTVKTASYLGPYAFRTCSKHYPFVHILVSCAAITPQNLKSSCSRTRHGTDERPAELKWIENRSSLAHTLVRRARYFTQARCLHNHSGVSIMATFPLGALPFSGVYYDFYVLFLTVVKTKAYSLQKL